MVRSSFPAEKVAGKRKPANACRRGGTSAPPPAWFPDSADKSPDRYGWTPNSREGLRLLALEGRIALSLEQNDRARKALTTAFHGFVQLGEPFEALLAAVRLARALLQGGAPRKEVRQLAHQMQPLLAAPKVPTAARQAVSSFVEDASASGPLNLGRLRELAELLEKPGGR